MIKPYSIETPIVIRSLHHAPHAPLETVFWNLLQWRMRCPLCGKDTAWEGNCWRPFCSERCQLIDLGSWAGEHYRIAGPSLMVPPTEADSHESDTPN